MTVAGCYTLDLYCRNVVDHSDDTLSMEERNAIWRAEQEKHGTVWPHQFTGQSLGQCKRRARRLGWVFHRDGDVTCPKCSKRSAHGK